MYRMCPSVTLCESVPWTAYLGAASVNDCPVIGSLRERLKQVKWSLIAHSDPLALALTRTRYLVAASRGTGETASTASSSTRARRQFDDTIDVPQQKEHASTNHPKVKPFPPGLPKPHQARDWGRTVHSTLPALKPSSTMWPALWRCHQASSPSCTRRPPWRIHHHYLQRQALVTR